MHAFHVLLDTVDGCGFGLMVLAPDRAHALQRAAENVAAFRPSSAPKAVTILAEYEALCSAEQP